MWTIVSMWKYPKMILFVVLTALLYAGSLFPLRDHTAFGGYADFGRIGVGIPVAFSFLFGPAAAWGAAIGNVIRDIVENSVDASSVFGFIGNFLIGYVPYKMWRALTAEKPDLRSVKKLALFTGISVITCLLCGLAIGWGLYWLGYTPFMPTTAIITSTNLLWAITVGAIVLAAVYPLVSKHRLLYTDILSNNQTLLRKRRYQNHILAAMLASAAFCFFAGFVFALDPLVLLPFVAVSLIAVALTDQ